MSLGGRAPLHNLAHRFAPTSFFPLPQLHPSLTRPPLQTPKSSLVYTPTTFFQLLLYSQLHSQRDRPTTRITGKCGWKDEKKRVEKVGLW